MTITNILNALDMVFSFSCNSRKGKFAYCAVAACASGTLRSMLLVAMLVGLSFVSSPADSQAAAFTWQNAAGGDWTVSSNWSPVGEPNGVGDTATLGDLTGAYTTTLASSRTIGELNISGTEPTLDISSTLVLSGGSSVVSGGLLTGSGTVELRAGADLTWSSATAPGGTLTFALLPGQTASIDNSAASNGFGIGTGQTLLIAGPISTVATTLTISDGFANDGLIQMGNTPPGDNYSHQTLVVTSGAITNNAAGQITLLPRSGTNYSYSDRYIDADIVNAGTITSFTTDGRLGQTGKTISNSGTMTLDSSIVSAGTGIPQLTVWGNSFTNTGTVNIDDGRFIIGTDAYTYGATETYNAAGGTLGFGRTGTSTTVNWTGADLTDPMTFEITAGADVTINRSSTWTLPANQSLLFTTQVSTLNQILTLDQDFTNDGSVVMGRTVANAYATQFFDIPTGTFTNGAAGTVTMYPRDGTTLSFGTRAIRADVQNNGLITSLTIDGQLGTTGKTVVNDGTITLDSSILSAGTGAPQITIFGTSFTNTSSGTININDGRFVVATDTFTYDAGTYNVSGGIFAFGGKNGATDVTWNGADFTDNMTFEINAGALVSIDRTTPWTIQANQKLDFSVSASTLTQRLTLNQDLNNSGEIIMGRGTGDAYASQFLTLTSGTFTNNASGVVTMFPRSATSLSFGNRAIEANVQNNGAINVLTIDGRLGAAGKTVVNAGTLTLDDSILSAGSGVAKMTVTGTNFINAAAGVINGNGTLNVLGTTFNNAGTLSPGMSAGQLTVDGNINFLSGGALVIEITGEDAVAGVDYDQLIVTGGVNGLSQADLVIDIESAAFDLDGDVFTILTAPVDFTGQEFNTVSFMGNFKGDLLYLNGMIQLTNVESFVPEPNTGLMLMFGLALLRTRRRQPKA